MSPDFSNIYCAIKNKWLTIKFSQMHFSQIEIGIEIGENEIFYMKQRFTINFGMNYNYERNSNFTAILY